MLCMHRLRMEGFVVTKKAAAGGAAFDASVAAVDHVTPDAGYDRSAREREVVEAEAAVASIEAKMAGWQASLDAAREAADVARQRLDDVRGQ